MPIAVIDLSTLDGTNGFRIDGINTNDYSGASVSSAGDVNGDGFDDVIVGTRYDGPSSRESGESYVVFGSAAGVGTNGVLGVASLDGTNGFRLDGIDWFDQFGLAVASAGDVNGDGFDDVIVGAPRADPNSDGSTYGSGTARAGESYVIFGSATGIGTNGVMSVATLNGTDGFRLAGTGRGDFSGDSVSSAGDMNGDGYDDVIVGAPFARTENGISTGEAHVVFGSARGAGSNGTLSLDALDGTNGFHIVGASSSDRFGTSVSSAGDVNGDGFDDVVIGANGADPDDDDEAGTSYVVFGSATGVGSGGVLDVSALNGTDGFRINGIDRFHNVGISVSGAGDVNGDGFDDVIVGSYRYSPLNGRTSASEAYVVFGSAGGIGTNGVLDLEALDGTNGFVIEGGGADDLLGLRVSEAGDMNGDGFSDVVVGAMGTETNGGSDTGASYVVFGSATGIGVNGRLDVTGLDGFNGFRLDGIDVGDRAGSSVSGAGDVNGDGYDDLIIGARGADAGGVADAGISYVVFGFDTSTVLGTAGADILTGGVGTQTIDGLAGNDRLEGGGGADILDGGLGFDTAIYGNATAGVGVNLGSGRGFLGEADGDTLTGIERVVGSAFSDALIGDAGGNVLVGGGGNDFMIGGAGNDVLDGGGNGDRLEGGLGADDLIGGAGFDTAFYRNATTGGVTVDLSTGLGSGGEAEGDTYASIEIVNGSFAADVLIGDDGMNGLAASAGDDVLDGRGGNDVLVGSLGADTFMFQDGHGTDRIMDFADGEDVLDYSAHTGVGSFGDLTVFDVGANAIVQDGAGGQVVLVGAAGTVDAGDFTF